MLMLLVHSERLAGLERDASLRRTAEVPEIHNLGDDRRRVRGYRLRHDARSCSGRALAVHRPRDIGAPQWVDKGTAGGSSGADERDVRDDLEVVAHGLRCGVLVLGFDGVQDRVVCHQGAWRPAGA